VIDDGAAEALKENNAVCSEPVLSKLRAPSRGDLVDVNAIGGSRLGPVSVTIAEDTDNKGIHSRKRWSSGL
jgi:hypothetical protein